MCGRYYLAVHFVVLNELVFKSWPRPPASIQSYLIKRIGATSYSARFHALLSHRAQLPARICNLLIYHLLFAHYV